ncbi:MarR family winged helix-turn-helix transcriptional regulator [Streptomyces sp. AC555_RSS877]|uniref:MarR family winged helix-turn-helix transcriptional regulator n=1 Tax=Streptomyces sp. AC555_RSS877 TaxID=2823688 RepID=UPI001C2728F9|nr:MarR family transcriptional regulator [Streptomyces sp. AC555_RSS877]
MPEPKWLNDSEARAWNALMRMMRALDQALDQQLQHDSQIPHGSYVILHGLSLHEGQDLRIGDLAQSLGWSQSRLSHAVARMEKADWIRRIPSPTDKRSNLVELTDAGRQKLVEAAPGHVAAVRHLVIDALSPEQLDQLAQAGETIIARAADILGEAMSMPFQRSPR